MIRHLSPCLASPSRLFLGRVLASASDRWDERMWGPIERVLLVGEKPPRMFKRDTVSEKFNKAENHLRCQSCLPKAKYPEWLLPIDGGENSIFPK